jgi:hypothetical protein
LQQSERVFALDEMSELETLRVEAFLEKYKIEVNLEEKG